MPKINVDFSNVGDGFSLPAEGDHICKVKSISLEEGAKGKYLKWTLVIGTGPDKGNSVFHNTSFVPAALFNLRNTLIACGQNVPKAAFQVNTDACIGKIVGITITHKEYTPKDSTEKKKSVSITEIYPVIKTDKGFVRADKAPNITNDSVAQTEDPPFDTDDADEIDI